jgi:hypothetical protein
MLGLLCLLVVSMVTGTMAINARNSVSAPTHREVNSVRLLVDSVSRLRGSKEDMFRTAQRSNRQLESWAAGYKMRYTRIDGNDGTVQVVLEKCDG